MAKLTTNKRQNKLFQSTLAIGLIAGLVGACGTQDAPVTQTPSGTTNVQADDVADDAENYIGQVVTVRSEPLEVVGDSSFTIGDEQFFGTEPILVINTSGEPLLLPKDGVEVQVTGEVRNFVIADVEREFGLTLDQTLYVDYEEQPAIIAQSIALAPDPGEITSNPEQYYGETLAVTGEVEDIQSGFAFSLDEEQLIGAEDLLVIYAPPTGTDQSEAQAPPVAVTDGEKVAVTGTLRAFVVSEFERDYDMGWDLELQEQLEAEYSNKPVLVATDVYASAIPED
ncbi:hypothetical protein [Phormidium tenue]|uniref:Uncharacterized protein n=1 Tax=Phormidium tenue NIES-30 TaxID=549789 RepID=A0A1U7J276_9CYAN|nr:hypothetical protein [Phormidium tenue]MBD2233780.1 hypothetical protein [Phormidium tenue FACHB-1052]OKH46191.1 hypothetical protein NIES30_18030 [Phormidium tenue NIES-30]